LAGARLREGGYRAAALPPQNRNLKKAGFVDTIILNVEHDCHFKRNHPLKPSDDCYIEIFKNKMLNLGCLIWGKTPKKIRPSDLNQVN